MIGGFGLRLRWKGNAVRKSKNNHLPTLGEIVHRAAYRCAAELRELLLNLPDDDARLDVIASLKICQHCGANDINSNCTCRRDD